MTERAEAISAWSDSAVLESPDGRFEARMQNAFEIAMGGPTMGTLELSNGLRWHGCNPSMVWSDDSRYLALPMWDGKRRQHLMVISLELGEARFARGELSVCELDTFEDGIISGVERPGRLNSMRITFDTAKLDWSPAGRSGKPLNSLPDA